MWHALDPDDDATALAGLISRSDLADPIVVVSPAIGVQLDRAMALFEQWMAHDLVGLVAPIPVAAELASTPVFYEPHVTMLRRAAPTTGTTCAALCAISAATASALAPSLPEPHGTVADYLHDVAARLVELGFRNVGAPGLAHGWSPTAAVAPSSPGWWRRYVVELDSESNGGLASHRLWIRTRLQPTRLVLDGACMTADTHTGTQRVVIELARALVSTRPTAEVSLAVPAGVLAQLRHELGASGVRVVERDRSQDDRYDIVYRPYQMLRASELAWCYEVAPRLAVGQLDMIGFSNPSYHPSAEAFFLARNLQRAMMEEADVVTFISDFGLRSASAECPQLAPERMFVVSCGVDVTPLDDVRPVAVPEGAPYVAMVSATFSHKNRPHAIEAFARLCSRHGFDGYLVIAGPEPYYGRSESAEHTALADIPLDVQRRIVRLGLVSEAEKWWLVRNAAVVLYPSIVEGFGLVPFEAAAVDTPSLSYCGTALREILDHGPATVDTWSTDVWADRMDRIITDPNESRANIEHVRSAGARQTWTATASRTWDALDTALALPISLREEGPALAHVARRRRHPSPTLAARAVGFRVWHAARRRLGST